MERKIVLQNNKYEVDEVGNVFNRKTGRKLSQQVCRKGYFSVKLQGKRFKTHRLILASFHGEIPKAMTVNHIDGNKKNNSISNLEWLTNSQNIKHSAIIGLRNYNKKESHPKFKLTKELVSQIENEIRNNAKFSDIKNEHNISETTFYLIKHKTHFNSNKEVLLG